MRKQLVCRKRYRLDGSNSLTLQPRRGRRFVDRWMKAGSHWNQRVNNRDRRKGGEREMREPTLIVRLVLSSCLSQPAAALKKQPARPPDALIILENNTRWMLLLLLFYRSFVSRVHVVSELPFAPFLSFPAPSLSFPSSNSLHVLSFF